MNPRIRRLHADYEGLKEFATRSDIVSIETVEGSPPERYVIHLNCVGIERIDRSGKPQLRNSHRLEVQLHDSYPSRKPLLNVLTKIYHPNISARGTVCIGDAGDHGYAPSMKLADLVMRIVGMIRYENVGLQSPFNMEAKKWAAKNMHLFPLDESQIINEPASAELEITILDEEVVGDMDDILDEISIL